MRRRIGAAKRRPTRVEPKVARFSMGWPVLE
jgi:hypothetical protein